MLYLVVDHSQSGDLGAERVDLGAFGIPAAVGKNRRRCGCAIRRALLGLLADLHMPLLSFQVFGELVAGMKLDAFSVLVVFQGFAGLRKVQVQLIFGGSELEFAGWNSGEGVS